MQTHLLGKLQAAGPICEAALSRNVCFSLSPKALRCLVQLTTTLMSHRNRWIALVRDERENSSAHRQPHTRSNRLWIVCAWRTQRPIETTGNVARRSDWTKAVLCSESTSGCVIFFNCRLLLLLVQLLLALFGTFVVNDDEEEDDADEDDDDIWLNARKAEGRKKNWLLDDV